MKFKTIVASLTIALSAVSFVSFGQSTDAVKQANKSNDDKADKHLVSEDDADFLVKSADARMMGAQEGKLATEKGTSDVIKNYGHLMMKDQDMLLKKIKTLAKKKNITLPTSISDKKEDGREDLAEESGNAFDKKFAKMMVIDHERDVKLFKEATKSDDKDISHFAVEYLPLIESHLSKIKSIQDQLK